MRAFVAPLVLALNVPASVSAHADDRHVSLDSCGAMFIPGTYQDRVEAVDNAATFGSIRRVNQPSSVEGNVLTQVMKPETGVSMVRAAEKKGMAK